MSALKYAPPHWKFMSDKIRELDELGLVYKNAGAEWASPPLILPKPGPDQYRMTIDLRVPDASTKSTKWPMPNLQDELLDLHGSEVFTTLDFCQAICRYLCTKNLKTVNLSSRQMEYTNRRMYYMEQEMLRLKSVLVVMMDAIKSSIKVLLDDCQLYEITEDVLLATPNFLFKQCQKYGLKQHASKFKIVCNQGKVLR
jgi:hypothetical protein